VCVCVCVCVCVRVRVRARVRVCVYTDILEVPIASTTTSHLPQRTWWWGQQAPLKCQTSVKNWDV